MLEIEIYADSEADRDRAVSLARLVRESGARTQDKVWVVVSDGVSSNTAAEL